MVVFTPIICPQGTHTEADAATGSRCICQFDFVPEVKDTAGNIVSCHRQCDEDTVISSDGKFCECRKGSYNIMAGLNILQFLSSLSRSGPASRTGGDATETGRLRKSKGRSIPRCLRSNVHIARYRAECDCEIPTLPKSSRENTENRLERVKSIDMVWY
eukprot:COSAG01_NODE_1587_length_9809_cov_13.149022_1_plen_159_part_00